MRVFWLVRLRGGVLGVGGWALGTERWALW